MAEVEPGDVHPGLDEGADLVLGSSRGAQGADDLGAAHVPSLVTRAVHRPTGTGAVDRRPADVERRSSDDERTGGRVDRARAARCGRPDRRRRPPPRTGPRRWPTRSATAHGRRRRRRTRRARGHVGLVALDVAARVELDAELRRRGPRPRSGPRKPIASSTSSAGISRSLPSTVSNRPSTISTSTSAQRRATRRPAVASPTNSLGVDGVDAARRPPRGRWRRGRSSGRSATGWRPGARRRAAA